jgi:hypothetical protein
LDCESDEKQISPNISYLMTKLESFLEKAPLKAFDKL